MFFRKSWSTLISIVIICSILGASVIVIAYGRGYRFNITQGSIKPTGLLVATSDPTGAQVLVDGSLKSATNTTINLSPNWYTVTIAKEGYQSWEKKLRVQGEIVSRADAFLLPSNPSLTAITTTGIVNPSLSPDGSKIVYIIPESAVATTSATARARAGVWVLDLTDRPLGLNRDARQIARVNPINLTQSQLYWSPDSKQIIAQNINKLTQSISNYLLEANIFNDPPRLLFDLKPTMQDWTELAAIKNKEKIATLPEKLLNINDTAMNILAFSPDETKIFYQATAAASLEQIIIPALIGTNPTEEVRDLTPGQLYVYDIKEDRNYNISNIAKLPQFPTFQNSPNWTNLSNLTNLSNPKSPKATTYRLPPTADLLPLFWLPSSRHLLLVNDNKIEIIDYDGTNRRTLYAGPFWDNFAVPWTSGGKVIILTNLNPGVSALSNLYAINLR